MLVAGLVSTGQAQQTYKETKSFSQSHPFEEGHNIKINGERTFMTISTWDKNMVAAEIEVISRYKEQGQAQKDLEKIKVNFEKTGNTVIYGNSILVDDDAERPKSNLKTIVHLTVPEYAEMEIKNSFGELTLIGSIRKVRLQTNFSTTSISDHKGTMRIYSKYGKVSLQNCDGHYNLEGDRSDLSIAGVGGELYAYWAYGNMDLAYDDRDHDFEIQANYTPVTLMIPEQSTTYYDIECKKCDLQIDNCNSITNEDVSSNKHKASIGIKKGNKAITKLESVREDITIISVNPKISQR